VYGYRHPITKVWRYIGKGSGRRKQHHLHYANSGIIANDYSNPRLISWIRKLLLEGVEPEIVVLKASMSEEEAYSHEAELIELIGRVEDNGTLYNLESGGSGGKRLSIETRRKQSEAMKGKPSGMLGKQAWNKGKVGQPAWNKGKQISDETRLQISKSHKGKPGGMIGKKHSEETRREMSKIQKDRWIERKACS